MITRELARRPGPWRRALLALVLVTGGCAQAVQHPVPTFAVVGAGLGFGTCEMAAVGVGTCGEVGGIVGLALAGVTALVYLVTDQPTPQMAGEEVPEEMRAPRGHHAPIVLEGPPGSEGPEAGSGSAAGSGSGSGSDLGSDLGGSASIAPP